MQKRHSDAFSRSEPLRQVDLGRAHVAAAVLVPLLLLAIVAGWSWSNIEAEAKARNARLALTLAEHARRVLETQEMVLEAALSRVRGMTQENIRDDRGVHEFLQRLEGHSLSTSSISIVDLSAARILASSAFYKPAGTDLSGRDYIAVHRRAEGQLTHVGEVVRGAFSGTIGFTVTRRDPETGLVAVTLVPRDQFLAFYSEVKEGERDTLTLARDDGAALVIRPVENPIGYHLPPGSVMMRFLRGELASPARARSVVDGVERMWSYAKVGDYPVFALYGLDLARIRAAWLRRLAPFALLAALSAAVLLITSARAQRAVAARQRADLDARWSRLRAEQAEALQAKTAQLESLLTSAPLGLAFFDRQRRFVLINEELAAINGRPAADHIGRRFEDVVPGPAAKIGPVLDRVFADGEAVAGFEVDAEVPGSPGTQRSWLTGFYPAQVENGKVVLAGAWVTEITGRKRMENDLRASEERLRLFIEHAPAAIAMLDRDMRYVATSRRWREDYRLGDAPLAGRSHYEVFPEIDERWRAVHQRALTGCVERSEAELFVRRDGTRQWLAWEARPWFEADGEIGGIMLVTQDITERREREEHLDLLMREVNHRAKNMLSVVQSVARATARQGDPATFAARLSDRIQGLAKSQDLLVDNSWHGVELDALVRSQLSHFADLLGTRIEAKGPAVRVSAAAAQGIGMALHELATNAGKYGALSSEQGRVDVAWELAGDTFRMRWTETGGPPVREPERQKRGFGHTVVEALAGSAVLGEARVEYPAEGVRWTLAAPVASVLDGGSGHRPAQSAGHAPE